MFRLKVWDEQGSSSEDTVSVIVKAGRFILFYDILLSVCYFDLTN